MFTEAKPSIKNASALAIDNGTEIKMIKGSRQLSNCAASTR
jgi:hypothetical protein